MGSVGPTASVPRVAYPEVFVPETSPFDLSLVAAWSGYSSPATEGGFRFLDIGCGPGLSTCLLAASCPEGRFVGIDLLEEHVEAARNTASSGGLENARFIRSDVRDWRELDLPSFDFITLHGLYSWVSPDARTEIVALLGDRLRPGGLAYVSYNALPGWGSVAAIRDYFLEEAGGLTVDPTVRAEAVRDRLRELRDLGAPIFDECYPIARMVDVLLDADPRYIAHEFLAEHSRPFHLADVSGAMAAVGLRYVGNCDRIPNYPPWAAPEAFLPMLEEIGDRVKRETRVDFIVNRCFRRDLYRREGARGDRDPLEELLFGLTALPTEIPPQVAARGREVVLDGRWFESVKHVLSDGPKTLEELEAHPLLEEFSAGEIRGALRQLAAAGHLRRFRARDASGFAPALNRERLRTAPASAGGVWLAAPAAGTAIWLTAIEALLLAGGPDADPATLEGFRTGKLPWLIRLGVAEATA